MRETIKLRACKQRLIAHRGLSGLERENTCASFIAAGNRSYFGIETDIHRTADGKYIVIHDDNAKRVADVDICIEETPFNTLRSIRMTDLDGNPRGDLLFPSLEEYILICKQYNKNSILEIKNHFNPEDIANVIHIIRRLDWLDRTVFISFDLPNCVCLREKLPEQRVQYLVKVCGEDVLKVLKEKKLDLDMYYGNCTKEICDACHEMGAVVNVWTVNDLEAAYMAVLAGGDFITTNFIE